MAKKVVLEEDEYVNALDSIIERDFFPDLLYMKLQTMWLDALATKDHALIAQTRQYILNEQKKQPQARTSSRSQPSKKRPREEETTTSSWDLPTPPREMNDIDEPEENHEESIVLSSNDGPDTTKMTLNHFVATHTSEDNASFEELQEKSVAEHKQKYHWAFDDDAAKTKLLLLSDGTKMTTERRQLMDKACDTKLALEDSRPAAPETWKFRAQNQLHFPPDIDTSRNICKVEAKETLLLENGPNLSKQLAKVRTGAVMKKPMETVYANSRFTNTFLANQDVVAEIEAPEKLDLVEMTPLITPGDASPLMTWGAIAATPMIIKGETPQRGPSFEIKETSEREKLALAMDAKNKLRMKAKKTPTPFRRAPKNAPTPLLSVFRAGAHSELRASYATPLVRSGLTQSFGMATTYKLAIVGGGPAGIGIFVRAARLGYLEQLLTNGVVLIHDGPIATLGRGKLGDYIINSNTFAKSLLGSVLDEKPELDPPESIQGTYLESLSAHPSAQRLAQVGNASISLIELGKFLEAVGYATRLEIMKHTTTSDCLVETKAIKIERTGKDVCKITTRRDGVESIVWAENVVLATGGTQELPPPAELDPCYLPKTWTSDKVLCEPGRRELSTALANAKDRKVCIIGGSHSAFSVAWVLLNKMQPKSKMDDSKPIQFNAKDITILHRGAIRCFYNTRKEAEADGVVVDKSDRAGNINTFTGLREDAKALYMAASTGHEPRVKLYQVKRGAAGAALRKQAFDGASAIIWCCGYTTNMIPIIDGTIEKSFSISRGAVKVDLKGRVIDSNGESLSWLFGVGIGFYLRAAVDEMKEETRADGVTVYHRRGATLVLAALFGTCIYGKDCNSFEEMIEKCEKRRKEDKQHESKIPLTPGMSKKRISQPLVDDAQVQNQLTIAPRKSSLTTRKEMSPPKQNKNQTVDDSKAIRRSSFELGRHVVFNSASKAPKSCGKPVLAGAAQHAIRSIRTGVL